MDSRLVILFTFCLFGQCMGHGAMYFPNPWWSQSECSENMSPADCEFHCYKEEEFASNCEPKDNMGCNRGCNLGVMAFFYKLHICWREDHREGVHRASRAIQIIRICMEVEPQPMELTRICQNIWRRVWCWRRKSMGLHWQSRRRRRSLLWWILDMGKRSQNKQMETGMWGILSWTFCH